MQTYTEPYNNKEKYVFEESKIFPPETTCLTKQRGITENFDKYINILNGSKYAGVDISQKISIEDEYRRTCEGWYHADNSQLAPIYRHFASQCDVVAEFGVNVGCSARCLLAGHPKKFIGVDLFGANKIINRELIKVQHLILKRICDDNNIEFEFFIENDLLVDIGEVDLLHLDSNHEYNHVVAQLNANEHKVQRYILMHDYFRPSVHKAVDTFLETTKIFKIREIHTYTSGLAVLERQ